jgi:hypothetical protein
MLCLPILSKVVATVAITQVDGMFARKFTSLLIRPHNPRFAAGKSRQAARPAFRLRMLWEDPSGAVVRQSQTEARKSLRFTSGNSLS